MVYQIDDQLTTIIVASSTVLALCLFFYIYRTMVTNTSTDSRQRSSRVSPLLFRFNQSNLSSETSPQINFGAIVFDDCFENHQLSDECQANHEFGHL